MWIAALALSFDEHSVLFSLPSNPSLGSVESPVSILLPGLIKHGHTATGSLASPHWTAKALWLRSCKRSRAHAHTPRGLSQLEFILGNLNAPFILIGHCKVCFIMARERDCKRHAGEQWARWEQSGRGQRGIKWVNGFLVWQGYWRPQTSCSDLWQHDFNYVFGKHLNTRTHTGLVGRG